MDPATQPTPTPVAHKHPSYIGIWVALAALTAGELGIAFLPWSKTVLIIILVALAFWKAILVALYYMHLRFENRRVTLLALAPLPFVVILLIAGLMEKFD
jgi:cytochrome c oxidase subunit IV